jgi:phage terminase large subunit GpA-like protein
MSSTDWANKYRWLAAEQSAHAGKYSTALTPWVPGMLDALDDPKIREVVCQKSAQVAWTDGVLNNYLGRRMHLDPCPVVMLFPKDATIKRYLRQKLTPMIRVTPVLRGLIDITASRSSTNTQDYKEFPGGFLALVGSNSPDNVKTISAPVGAVEEPDDCSTDTKGQGDSVELLRERLKTYENSKLIFGGTPTIKDHSRVETAFQASDQRHFWVPCHQCGKPHVLTWDNVIWDEDPRVNDEVLGHAVLDSARYVCPHCGVLWTDRDKNLNVRRGYWVNNRPTREVAGFAINELYSPFPGSKLAKLVEKHLKAQYKKERGDESAMITFTNNTLGLAYEYQDGSIDAEALSGKAEEYSELIVPRGGLALALAIDVQPDRLALIIRAYGREEESWLVYWGEIHAKVGVTDTTDPVWAELDKVLFGSYRHADGYVLSITVAAIDSSDGNTNDAVYHYVRTRRGKGPKLMAIKGSKEIDQEIVRTPKKVDVDSTSKAARFGLEVWHIGVNRAKDLIAERLKLSGVGPGRMHFYDGVRSDYPDQMTGESKIPSRTQRNKKVWTRKAGRPVEAWDCEVYNLFCARQQRWHIRNAGAWDDLEGKLKQGDLLSNGGEVGVVDYIDGRPNRGDVQDAEPAGQVRQPQTQAQQTAAARSMADLGRRNRG